MLAHEPRQAAAWLIFNVRQDTIVFPTAKGPLDTDTLARLIRDELVVPLPEQAAKHLRLPEESRLQYREKANLYAAAVVLMVLLSEETKDATFAEVIVSFEKLIFPPTPTEDGMQLLARLKEAMRDLGRLIEEDKPMSWALAWLAEIGAFESNPITLHLFARVWIESYICASKFFQQLKA